MSSVPITDQSPPAQRVLTRRVLLLLPPLLGAALRWPAVWSNRFHADEALFATWSRLIYFGDDRLLVQPGVDKTPLLFYLQAGFYPLFDGAAPWVARLPNVTASLLLIALAMRLARAVGGGRRAALAAGFLVALSPLAIQFSATGFTDPLLTALVMGAILAAAVNRPVAAGLLWALALAAKLQALLFLPVLLLVVPVPRLQRRFWSRWAAGAAAPLLLLGFWLGARGGPLALWATQMQNYGGLRLSTAGELWPGLRAWLEPGGLLLGRPAWTVGLLLLGVVSVLGRWVSRRALGAAPIAQAPHPPGYGGGQDPGSYGELAPLDRGASEIPSLPSSGERVRVRGAGGLHQHHVSAEKNPSPGPLQAQACAGERAARPGMSLHRLSGPPLIYPEGAAAQGKHGETVDSGDSRAGRPPHPDPLPRGGAAAQGGRGETVAGGDSCAGRPPHPNPLPRGGEGSGGVWLFVGAYLFVHWLLAIPAWDRYLLPLVPLVAVGVALPLERFGRLSGRAPRTLAAAVVLIALTWGALVPAWQARAGLWPVGASPTADDGAQLTAAALARAPWGTVLYDHWYSWQWRYYFVHGPVYVSWFADPAVLAEDVAAHGAGDTARYLAWPAAEAIAPLARALAGAGYALKPQDRFEAIDLYRIVADPAATEP